MKSGLLIIILLQAFAALCLWYFSQSIIMVFVAVVAVSIMGAAILVLGDQS